MGNSLAFLFLLLISYIAADDVICYYNSQAYYRQGNGKFELSNLNPALEFCTHIIYGYAGIHPDNYKLIPLDENLDVSKGHYRDVTNLKRRYPGIKVFLSVGGFQDVQGEGSDRNLKYRTLIEAVDKRLSFVNSAKEVLKNYGFDGLDLGWEFPENKPKVIRGTISNFFHNVKVKIVGENVADDKVEAHKEQFVALVRELKSSFRHDNLKVSLSVLPNVNASEYYNIRDLASNLDMAIIHAYDFYTPDRNPYEADYPAPLYENVDRKFDENGDYQVRYWLSKSFPANKLVLAIPTYGRAWKMTSSDSSAGIPPVTTDGPAEEGPHVGLKGLRSYSEICDSRHNDDSSGYSRGHSSNRYGMYAFKVPGGSTKGVWVGYEDEDTVANKASYARNKGLAGVALVDLTMDDYNGLCTNNKFPLLRAALSRF